MGLVDKYRWGNNNNIPVSNIEIDSLSTLESIKRRQGWMITAQIATVAAIAHQTKVTTDALKLVNDTLVSIEDTIQNGFNSLESSIERLESNLIENLNEIRWYLFNVDQKLDQLINLVKFSGATKSAEYNRQGFILYKIGIHEEAISQLKKSLHENPLNIEAYINLGFVYLRMENLDESIKNFELASKLVNEDFSYFEEISVDRLRTTEVFILDNLSTLYSMRDQNHQSIELMNKILDKEIDKKTEIITKYKLAKYKCLIREFDDALEIIKELINNQYLEPVALAVSNPEFSEISHKILETLQTKLESVKKSFQVEAKNQMDKINVVNIDPDFKNELISVLTKLTKTINESSNYSILLTSEFKESHNEYLQYLDLLNELKAKTEIEQFATKQDINRLEEIGEYNSKIATDYTDQDTVIEISHKVLLGKIKNRVKVGIDQKINSFEAVQKLYDQTNSGLNEGLKKLSAIDESKMIEFISSGFDIATLSKSLIPLVSKDEKEATQADKISKEYAVLVEKCQAKQKIESNSSNSDDDSDGDIEILDFENYELPAIKLIKDILGVDLKTARDLADDCMISGYPLNKMIKLRAALIELGVEIN